MTKTNGSSMKNSKYVFSVYYNKNKDRYAKNMHIDLKDISVKVEFHQGNFSNIKQNII